jgi:hypothetical protein
MIADARNKTPVETENGFGGRFALVSGERQRCPLDWLQLSSGFSVKEV